MKTQLKFLFIFLFSFAFSAHADELAELRKRLDDLEARQSELYLQKDDQKDVSSYFENNLTLGGFFDGGIDGIWGPNTKTQINPTDQILGINVSAQVSERFFFLGQFVHLFQYPLENPHNNPDGLSIGLPKSRNYGGATLLSAVSQAALEYKFSRLFNLQGGQGFAPFGYILEVREPVLYIRSKGPQLTTLQQEFAAFWTGLHLYGSASLPRGEWGYNFYSFNPVKPSDKMGLGARSWIANESESIIAGLSFQIADAEDETYKTAGADVRFRLGSFQLQTEYAEYFSQLGENTWTAYAEPGVWVKNEEFLLFVFTDYAFHATHVLSKNPTPLTLGTTTRRDPYQLWQHGVGVNWVPTSRIRIRLQYTLNDYRGKESTILGKDRDYNSIKLSGGVSF